jgi:hypothetical protein
MPHSRIWRWNCAIEAADESRGCSPVLIAWFSAGRPNASYPIGCSTLRPLRRWKWATASPTE